MRGRRVVVTVSGERREGTVVETAYTVQGGEPVVAVALDRPLPDGRSRYLAAMDDVEAV